MAEEYLTEKAGKAKKGDLKKVLDKVPARRPASGRRVGINVSGDEVYGEGSP